MADFLTLLVTKARKGADTASAGTLTIPDTGDRFDITGTTGITVIDTGTRGIGSRFYLRFTGILTITHDGAAITLNGAANITTAAADVVLFEVTGTNTVQQVSPRGLVGNAATATALATARSIYGNNFDGTAALNQVIASTYGGTGNGFSKFSGPTTAEKTFTLPNANATILTSNAAVTVAQGGTGAASLTGIVIGNGTSAMSTVTAPTGTVLGTTDTQTVTNKDLTSVTNTFPPPLPRVATTTSSGTPTPDVDTTDAFILTAQAATAAFVNPTGTPASEQRLVIKIKDNATAQTITWDTAYVARGAALPSTTVISKIMRILFVYNLAQTTWDCVGVAQEA